ncbi:hypothetical protein RF11_11321 [Thelohanellus kitauei]|uniref:Uncharacterized protein n=1 Tax=Thelohanellus kitauei TaxID=669202 RepID=A0A0C2MHU2_THEKT|nr:hypothetical protein RF11_11321 [Thelohanellus kitauei]
MAVNLRLRVYPNMTYIYHFRSSDQTVLGIFVRRTCFIAYRVFGERGNEFVPFYDAHDVVLSTSRRGFQVSSLEISDNRIRVCWLRSTLLLAFDCSLTFHFCSNEFLSGRSSIKNCFRFYRLSLKPSIFEPNSISIKLLERSTRRLCCIW